MLRFLGRPSQSQQTASILAGLNGLFKSGMYAEQRSIDLAKAYSAGPQANACRERLVVLGSGWAAASLARHIDTSKFAITVRTQLIIRSALAEFSAQNSPGGVL